MKYLIVALLSILLSLTGCGSFHIQRYAPMDLSNKTVTVPPGSWGLNGKLKQALAKDGWRLVVNRGASITEGTIGKETKIKQYDSFNSRYRLVVSSQQYDWCLNFSPAISYDISFVDNKSGAEIFTMSGNACEAGIVEKFTDVVRGAEA